MLYSLAILAILLSSLCLSASATTLHQRVPTRTYQDVCAKLDFNLTVNHHNYGNIHECVCTSTADRFCDENKVAKHAVNSVNRDRIVGKLVYKVKHNRQRKQCQYPEHAYPAPEFCTVDPCTFGCNNGFQPWPPVRPLYCACLSPRHQYNGKCVLNPPMPSHVPWL